MANVFLTYIVRTCEMENSWQLVCANNGGGSHMPTIVYNERTIGLPYFLQFGERETR